MHTLEDRTCLGLPFGGFDLATPAPPPHIECTYFVECALAWTERHAGLGGWVGAVGAVAAIFVTWMLARAEYTRVRRAESARRNAELVIILQSANDVENLVETYMALVRSADPSMQYFYNLNMNDDRLHAARDLANMQVLQWPSLEMYLSFRRYWFAAIAVLETSSHNPVDVKSALDKENRMKKLKDPFMIAAAS